jgi:hypothetical protein
MSFQSFTYAKRPSDVLNGGTIDIQLLMSESHLYPFDSDCDTDSDTDSRTDPLDKLSKGLLGVPSGQT